MFLNNICEIQIILQNKTRSYTYESLYNYAAEIVRHNVFLAGNVLHYKVVSLQRQRPPEYTIVLVAGCAKESKRLVVRLETNFFPTRNKRNLPTPHIIAKHCFSSMDYFVSTFVSFLLAYATGRVFPRVPASKQLRFRCWMHPCVE